MKQKTLEENLNEYKRQGRGKRAYKNGKLSEKPNRIVVDVVEREKMEIVNEKKLKENVYDIEKRQRKWEIILSKNVI